jgi:hypothetical protein
MCQKSTLQTECQQIYVKLQTVKASIGLLIGNNVPGSDGSTGGQQWAVNVTDLGPNSRFHVRFKELYKHSWVCIII